jgi:hypothetical protein
VSGTPQILRCESTGRCWQVAWWPEAGSPKTEVSLRRGELVITVPVETVFEKYTVVC